MIVLRWRKEGRVSTPHIREESAARADIHGRDAVASRRARCAYPVMCQRPSKREAPRCLYRRTAGVWAAGLIDFEEVFPTCASTQGGATGW